MSPLDLTKIKPRKATCDDHGIVYLGRTIDKVRASLPNGDIGVYLIGSNAVSTTMSRYLFHVLKTTEEEFCEVVRRAESEDEVVDWVHRRAAPEKIERWNSWINGFRLMDLPADIEAFFFKSNPSTVDLPRVTRVIDALDYEDRLTSQV